MTGGEPMNVPETHDPARHDEIWRLLPWYVNGTLEPPEAARVRTHVRACRCCREEVAVQRALRESVRAAAPIEAALGPALEKLRGRIHAESDRPALSVRERAVERVLTMRRRWFNASRRRPLILAATALLFAAAVLPLIRVLPERLPESPAPVFHTAADPGSLGQFDANDIRVVFARPLSPAAIEAIVAPLQGRVVGGPVGPGVYTIRFDGRTLSPEALATRIKSLRAHRDIALAEPALPVSTDPRP